VLGALASPKSSSAARSFSRTREFLACGLALVDRPGAAGGWRLFPFGSSQAHTPPASALLDKRPVTDVHCVAFLPDGSSVVSDNRFSGGSQIRADLRSAAKPHLPSADWMNPPRSLRSFSSDAFCRYIMCPAS